MFGRRKLQKPDKKHEENETPSWMETWAVTGLLGLIRAVVFVYDLLTFPIYCVVQQPWTVRKLAGHTRATEINGDGKADKPRKIDVEAVAVEHPDGIVYRSTLGIKELEVRLQRDSVDTLDKVFRFAVKQHGHRPALGTRQVIAEEDEKQSNGRVFKKLVLGDYQWRTFSEMDTEAESFGRGLRELGIKPQQNVVIFAETRAEWLATAFGCIRQNMPLVTLYASLGDDALIHGINETEAEIVITTQDLLPKFKRVLMQMPKVRMLVCIEDTLKPLDTQGFKEGVQIFTFKDVIKTGDVSTLVGTPPAKNDIAIIMYTSGSTGQPKGVLMSHNNLVASMLAFSNIAETYEDDVYMAYLPLAHVLELIAECMCMLYGIPIGYSSPLTMTDKSNKVKRGSKGDASVLKPTLMATVPLILDRIYKSIDEKVETGTALSKGLFNYAMDYKQYWYQRGFDAPIINKVIFKRIRGLLGGRIRFMLTGGAPLAPETHAFVRAALCCPVLQGYGLTETCACSTVMDLYDVTTGRVGGPLSCCDIKLVNWEEGNYRVTDKPYPRGEIHVGGDNVTVGYYKQPEQTKAEFYEENGRRWFRTGDIGQVHPDGVIQVIDRRKDLVKLQTGEYVSLGKIESTLKTCGLVENICVHAEPSKTFTVALLVPSLPQLRDLAQSIGVNGALTNSLEQLCADASMQQAALKQIQEHAKNCRLDKLETPVALRLISDAWTPDNGLVTAAFKLRRKNVYETYQSLLDDMYA